MMLFISEPFKRIGLPTILACFLFSTPSEAIRPASPDSGGSRAGKLWAYEILNIAKQKAREGAVVKVAVVDDGFRLSHLALKDFIYTNTEEIPDNFQDDDQNGYADDVAGWDVSDSDNDVSVPRGKENEYYHGTYIAGIITSVFQRCYGSDASKHLKIIPVKVLSDRAKNTFLADGYRGIRYACEMGADIICCAWSGGPMSDDDKALIRKAIGKGTIIVGSAGNFFSEKAEFPSSFPGVACVAALDSTLKKSKQSNFGMRVDLAAPGTSVYGAYPAANNSYVCESGTSPAAAIVAGCAAILKVLKPEASSTELLDALRNTSTAVDSINLSYCGKLGAGIPDMAKAAEYLVNPAFRYGCFSPSRPEGKIFYKKKVSPQSWMISPSGAFKGIHIASASANYKGNVTIFSNDSLRYSGPIGAISREIYIPGSQFKVELQSKPGVSKMLELAYYMETIDSTLIYCRDIQEIESLEGIVSDNSGSENYANNCSCKWLLKAPKGKRIRIEFDEMDTQPNVDFVWIFDGSETLQENILAKFSGSNRPPVITTLSNQVLLWFVTDSITTGKGWRMKYQVVD